MATARVFMSGNSQAVRIPREFQFDVDEVEIFRRGEEIILRKRVFNLADAFISTPPMPADFMADGREQEAPQEREDWT